MLRTLLQKVRGPRERCAPRGPRTRVPLPSVRTVHPDVLAGIQRYCAEFDYYVQRNGRILLLHYQPNRERMWRGRELLAWGINTVDALLMAAGFSLMDELEPSAIDTGRLERRAQQCAFAMRRPDLVELEHQRLRAETDGTASEKRTEKRWQDRIDAEMKSDHAIFFRHRKSFSYNTSH